MKRLFAFAALAAASFLTIGRGQQADDLGDLAVNVTPHISWAAGAGGAQAHLYCYGRTSVMWPTYTSDGSATTDLAQQSVRMVPGVTYSAVFNIQNSTAGWGPTGYRLTVQAPPGYSVQMMSQVSGFTIPFTPGNDFSGTFPNDGAQTHVANVSIRIVAAGSGAGMTAGSATGMRPAWVPWALSLGSLRNGLPGGTLYFNLGNKGADFTTAFSRNNLSCDTSSSEVVILSDSANSNTIRQVIAPQVCVDITGPLAGSTGGSFTIACYHPSQCSATLGSGSVFTFTGSPFLLYTVQQTDPNNATVTCDTHDTTSSTVNATVTRTLTTSLSRSGTSPNYTWTAAGWHTGTTAPVQVVRARSGATETISVTDGTNTALQTTNTYTSMLGDEEITQQQVGSSNAITTTYSYYTANTSAAGYGWEQLETRNDGSWQGFEYASNGTLGVLHGPWQNATSTGFPSDSGIHAALIFSADAFGQLTRLASSTTTLGATTTGQSSTTYSNVTPFTAYSTSHGGLTVVKALRSDSASSSSSLQTTTQTFVENIGEPTPGNAYSNNDDFFRDLPYASEQPDKVKQCFVQQRGTWDGTTFTLSANAGLDSVLSAAGVEISATRTTVVTGSSDSAAGSAYSRTDGYPTDALYLVDKKSTLQVTIRNQYGDVVHTETQAWVSNAWNVVASTNFGYNLAHQLTSRTNALNGATYSASYSGEQKASETDETGSSVSYTYDAADRVLTSTIAAAGSLGALVTQFTYDAASHVTKKTVGYGQSETLISQASYDDAGRVISQQDPGVNATTRTYAPSSQTATTTFPNGGVKTELSNYDGTLASVTSNNAAVVAEYYSYQINADGTKQTTVTAGVSGGPRNRTIVTDWLGRTISTTRPGVTGQPAYAEQATYGTTTGRLLSSARTAGTNTATTYYKYDVLGQVLSSGLHVDGTLTGSTADGTVNLPTPASNDRMADSDRYFESYQGAWWATKTSSAYPVSNDGNPVLGATVRTRLTNFGSGVIAETLSTDINSIVTDQVTTATSGSVTVTTTVKDATNVTLYTQTEKTVNGVPTSVTRFDGLTYTTGYDSLYRKSSSVDPRAGTTTYAYYSGTTFLSSVTDAAANTVVSYGYDTAGRTTLTTDAASHATRVEYNNRNQVVHQWGDGTYPVEYVYDATYGDRLELHTFQGTDAGGGNFAGTSWPGGTPASVTKWVYDAPSGLVTSKTDAANRAVTYTYNFRGQIATRTWARNVTTTYNYDSVTGELTGTTYSDSTPAVTYSYTRAGQLGQVTDATGSRVFNYGQTGATTATNSLRLDSINLPSYYGARVLTRKYDNVGRGAGFVLGSTFNSSSDLSQQYTYNSQGRFDHLVASNSADTTARTYTYSYNSGGLVSGMGMSGTLGSAGAFGISKSYEAHRNLLTTISAAVGTTVVAQHDYAYNTLGQRQTAQQSGTAFGDIGVTAYNNVYNARGELTSSADYIGGTANVGNTTYQMTSRNFNYGYDSIGNRGTSSRHGGSGINDTYAVNNLNQYTTRTNAYAETAGSVSASTTAVTVSGGGQAWSSAGHQGQFWADYAQISGATSTGAQAIPLTITATGTFTGTLYQRTDTSRTLYFPGVTQTLQYDADGNLTSDGLWTYTYDAENRLIGMQSVSIAGFPNKLLNFAYDYLNRRVEKKVGNWNGSAYVTAAWRRYLYDGDNLVAEFDASGGSCGALQRSYAWGLDLAGSLTSTGGVGALMQITNHTGTVTSYLPTYDGNGNVTSLVNASTGSVAVSYEYSPFGELLRRGGATSNPADAAILDNPFAFSTKFTDWETGLVYYGARFYSPSLGRFINRDPIEEAGGINLYGFCGNDGIDGVDYMGYSFLGDIWNHTIGSLGRHIAQNWDHARPYISAAASIVASIVVAIYAPELLPAIEGMSPGWAAVTTGAMAGFAGGFTGGVLSGQSLGASLRAGLIGGAIGGAMAGIGYEMSGPATPPPSSSPGGIQYTPPTGPQGIFASNGNFSGNGVFVTHQGAYAARIAAARQAAMAAARVAGGVGGVLGTGLSVGEFLSAAGSGAAHGLYNATVGAAVHAYYSGVDHMAGSWTEFSQGNYGMGTLHALAAAGDVAGLALTAVGAGELTMAGGRMAVGAFSEIAENGVGSFARSAGRFLYDNRSYGTVSREYWGANGPANGSSLHHWLFPQRASWVPQGIRNAGFNLMRLPPIISTPYGGLNQWMGMSGSMWAPVIEGGIRLAVPGAMIGAGYGGAELGTGAYGNP